MNTANYLFVSSFILLVTTSRARPRYPIPHRFYPGRPPPDPRCVRLTDRPFCYAGISLTSFADDDVIEVYHMLEDTTYIPRLNVTLPQHAGLGIRNMNTSRNYTLHLYGMFGSRSNLPLVQEDGTLFWCNQAASCFERNFKKKFMQGIAERHLVARTTGKVFNLFTMWVLHDNNTATDFDAYDAWRDRGELQWTEGWNCGTFVRRCFRALYDLGVRFFPDITPRYWLNAIYTKTPVYVGNNESIFGPDGNKALAMELLYFYKHGGTFFPVFKGYTYLYYNRGYWRAGLTNNTFLMELSTERFLLPVMDCTNEYTFNYSDVGYRYLTAMVCVFEFHKIKNVCSCE